MDLEKLFKLTGSSLEIAQKANTIAKAHVLKSISNDSILESFSEKSFKINKKTLHDTTSSFIR